MRGRRSDVAANETASARLIDERIDIAHDFVSNRNIMIWRVLKRLCSQRLSFAMAEDVIVAVC